MVVDVIDASTISEANFVLYAAKCYDNPHCDGTEEFIEDLKRFRYVKRLLNQYVETGELKTRLVLNHIIVIYNVFTGAGATAMLFYKLRGLEKYLKPFLVLLGRMPDAVTHREGVLLDTDVVMDTSIVKELRLL